MMVLRKFLLLLLAFQCYAVPVRIPTVGYEQKNPAAPQFFAYVPSTLAAYELPNHAMVHFQFPLGTYDDYGAKTFITVTLGTVEAATPSQNSVAQGWVPFVPFLFKWSVARWNIFSNSNRRAGPHPVLLPVNNWVRAGAAPLTNMCHLEAGTDESGKSLLSVLKGILGQGAAGPVGASCWYASGEWVTMWVPTRFLTPNPVFPDVRVSMTLSMLDHDWNNGVTRGQVGHLSLVVGVAVPYTTTAPEVQLSSLIFHKFVPSSTIHGVQLTSIRVSFTPGVNVLAGGMVAIMVQAPIFQDIPVAVGLTLTPIVIGYGNCAAEPTSPFCCFASFGYTRVSNGLFGYDSSDSDSSELHTGGFSTISIVLGPQGCLLPADKLVTFVIPQAYLGSNPSLIDATGPMSYSYAFRVVNVKIATSTEPEFVFLALYTGSDGPYYTSMQDSYKDISSDGATHAFAPHRYGMDPFNMYIIGTSTVSNFLISVDTLTTDMTPTWIRFSFSLSSDWVYPNTGTPPELPHTPQRILIAAEKVFKPNQGTIELPLQLGNGAFQPSSCTTVTYFTNSHSSLYITPNSGWSVACNDAMVSGAVVIFTLPGSILLPNPSAGTIVTFSIRVIPSYTVPDYVDSDINSDGVTIANSVDGATLMDVFGYQTVAVCGVVPYASGRVFDLAAMPTVDRCVVVAAMSVLSPTSAGILQCSTGAGLVTYVKVPEAMWTTAHWPQTNVASLGNWAQVISLAPASPLAYILSYGYMISYPMFAIVVSYPPTVSALQMLGVNPNVPAGWTVAFVVRLDRLTLSCQIANDNNPWRLRVHTTQNVVEVLLFVDHLALGAAGTPLLQVPGSAWGQGNGMVFITAAHGGAVVGYSTILVSPVPNEDDSDDALFGLLALIAAPILLLCCLAALLWFLRPKAEPCPGCPEYPVQEMYWVNAQPAAPVYMVEPAAQACMSAPPTTPIYLVQ